MDSVFGSDMGKSTLRQRQNPQQRLVKGRLTAQFDVVLEMFEHNNLNRSTLEYSVGVNQGFLKTLVVQNCTARVELHEPRIRLLGAPRILERDGAGTFPSKGFQMLALLCLSHDRRLGRKAIASLLWESESDRVTLVNLRQLLKRIKTIAPVVNSCLEVSATDVALTECSDTIDLLLFLDLAKSEAITDQVAAEALFAGNLLADDYSTTEEYADWLRVERQLLREHYFLSANAALMEQTRFGHSQLHQIESIATRLLSADPTREASYRSIIEAYGRIGNANRAAQVYQALQTTLAADIGVEPNDDIKAVIRRITSKSNVQTTDWKDTEAPKHRSPRLAFFAPDASLASDSAIFARALIEDVANELSRFRSFRCLAPHSSFSVAHDSGVHDQNNTLKADYSVSGFVRPGISDTVLSLRLVNCQDAGIVWSGEFSLSKQFLPRSFQRLVIQVAANLASNLERDLASNAKNRRLPDSYWPFLQGQSKMEVCDLPSLRRARKSFDSAIDEDRYFASAHARKAQTLYLEWLLLGADSPELALKARSIADLACKIDPNEGLGYWISAGICFYQRDTEEAIDKFSTAETLAPNSPDLLVEHANVLAHLGDPEAGWSKFEYAISLNPFPPDHYWWAGASIAFNRNDHAQVIKLCNRVENDDSVLRLLTASHALIGDIETAQRFGQRLLENYPGQTARGMVGISPDTDPSISERFVEGLRKAGVK